MEALYPTEPAAATKNLIPLLDDESATAHCAVWQEAWPVFRLYVRRLKTQWLMGATGAVGLNYAFISEELERMGLDAAERERYMDLLAIIEDAALRLFHPPSNRAKDSN